MTEASISSGRDPARIPTEPQFRTLAERSLAGIYLIQKGRFRYVNPRLADIFGYAVPELITSKPALDLVADEDRALVAKKLEQRLKGGVESVEYSFRGRRKDGAVIDVEVHGTRTEIDGAPAVFGTLIDVTRQKRAERALRRSEEHFRSLIENTTDIVHMTGTDGTIRYISPSVEQVLGYSPREMVGRNSMEFVHPDDREVAGRAVEWTLRRSEAGPLIELRLRHKDGSWRTLESRGITIRGEGGEPIFVVSTHDITDRKRIEEAARRAVRARDEVLGVVSHDLRNPLNTIAMAASLLRDATPPEDASTIKWLRMIQRNTRRMNVLINDLLDASSIDAEGFSVAPTRRDVAELLAEAEDLLRPLIEEQSIGWHRRIAEDVSAVWADADQILRVFSNLVGNALKFTPAGGAVTVGADRSGAQVRFSVSDTGPGIPEEQRSRVFDRHWQGGRGDRRGAGLGLTIARGIVEAHGNGSGIWCESTLGEGSTFAFTLPVAGPRRGEDEDEG